jgi:hypothetical protein
MSQRPGMLLGRGIMFVNVKLVELTVAESGPRLS